MRKPIDLNFKGTIKFTDAQLSEMAEMYEAGQPMQKIVEHFGICIDAIRARLSAMGVKSRPQSRPKRFTEADMQTVLEMRARNRSYQVIANKLGFNACHVRLLVRKHKLAMGSGAQAEESENTLPV